MKRRQDADLPQSWEHLLESRTSGLDDYARPGGLEDRIATLDAELAQRHHGRLQSAQKLYHDIPAQLAVLRGDNPSVIWATLLETIAAISRETAWRISCEEMPERANAGRRRAEPFGSVGQALEFALYSHQQLGVGPTTLWVAEDSDETKRTRASEALKGRDRGEGVGGYLPHEYIPAKQTHSGSTGGTRNSVVVDLRADVLRAVAATRIDGQPLSAIDWAIVVALDVGVYQGPAHLDSNGAMVPAYDKMTATALVGLLASVGVVTTAQRLGKRLSRLRRELQREMAIGRQLTGFTSPDAIEMGAVRGLVPPPRERYAHQDVKPDDSDPWAESSLSHDPTISEC